jgi:hypothetical protein
MRELDRFLLAASCFLIFILVVLTLVGRPRPVVRQPQA